MHWILAKEAAGMNPWIPVVVTVILAALSALGTLASWLYSLKMKRDTKELNGVSQRINAVKDELTEETKERVRVAEQLFSKVNKNRESISGLATTLSSTQNVCRDLFVTQREFDRVTKLREKQDDMRSQQEQRLERNVDRLIQGIVDMKSRRT